MSRRNGHIAFYARCLKFLPYENWHHWFGRCGKGLGRRILKHGHEVVLGTRKPGKLAGWGGENPKGRVASFTEAAEFAEVAVLAVKGTAAVDAIRAAGVASLNGKIVIDATNPIADAPPEHGVLKYFTTHDESLLEQLQREFAGVRFVKAFNSVGSTCMVNPQFKGGKPTMFICGNDATAKNVVTKILDQFGWETADMGWRWRPAQSSRCACSGAFPVSSRMTGCMRSSC